jgi:glycosyltransferase involved in cell wall biosynthesis
MRDDKWPIAEIAFWGLTGHEIETDGIHVYPNMGDPFGSDALLNHSIDFKANVAFTMQDVWSLQLEALQGLKQNNIPWIPYVPIDQEPVSSSILQRLNMAYKIITFSRYGQKTLEDHGYASKLILEGTDTNIFKPLDQVKCREELKLPQDMFLFGMIAANKENPPRKGFQEALEAFALFNKNHPNSGIFFHTQQTSPTGFPILEFANHLGIQKNVFFLNVYTSMIKANSENVTKEINACDVILHPSQTEGFGLLITEGQSCGKPVIIQRCTSMPELIIEGKTGWACETQKKWWRNSGGFVFMADVNSLHDQMEKVFETLGKSNTIAEDARKNIVENYNIDTIYKKEWLPFFEELQKELLTKPEESNKIKS